MNGAVTESLILELEDRRFQATIGADMPTLNALIAEDLRYVHSNGESEDKAEFLRKLASGERRYSHYEALSRGLRREGGFAFVHGLARVGLLRATGPLEMRLAYTAIYREAPAPRLMAWHSTKAA
ncbi:nuclear transport factor 2 family protein [Roseomonas sp. GC11]|uniref:nuclear transport factor 2 family protein n=1 Tax=Roseomonas sp. GC11 TaxID=2950546 RepID=UPI00210CB2A4|nr:nuclear transport factor 2 family protein [Roseomonas sp. GC11]MCQ4159033.1 nuclear transport factor 2 family protein [Roseomonas sp. GC11]